jgi:two-component system, chemotaxis family, chemotaxis protein CheY
MDAKRVLVVDDSQTVRRQIALALNVAGYEVIEAVDGIDGQAKVDETVAMVILDVNMPRMNGLELLELIKSDAKSANLPVVMLTTEGHPEMIARAKLLGAKGWIIKPFKAALLVAAVAKLVAAR